MSTKNEDFFSPQPSQENEVSFMNCSDYKRNLCYLRAIELAQGSKNFRSLTNYMHFEVAAKVGRNTLFENIIGKSPFTRKNLFFLSTQKNVKTTNFLLHRPCPFPCILVFLGWTPDLESTRRPSNGERSKQALKM